MRSLKEVGLSVVLISSNMGLSKESLGIANTMCSAVILRENRGWDFAGWALGITTLKGMYNASEIVIANDSVYGPMHPISEMFDFMNERPWDLWSVTESFEVDWHLQSYFLVFKRSAIASDCFRRFWENVRILRTKHSVISRYEIKLARSLFVSRARGGGLCTTRGRIASRNPTLNHWLLTLERGKSPFLKVQLLRDNPLNSDIAGWDKVVASRGYDPSLIRALLERTRG